MRPSRISDQTNISLMLEDTDLIQRATRLGFDIYLNNQFVNSTIKWKLQSLTETAGRLTEEIKATEPEIDWVAMRGTRNRLVHDPYNLREQIIWEIATQDIPLVREALLRMKARVDAQVLRDDALGFNARPLSIPPLVADHRSAIVAAARRRGFSQVRLFGSMVRGEYDDDSDVDLLVRAVQERADHRAQERLEDELQDLLGRNVDVVTDQTLYPLIRDRVLSEALAL